MQNRVQNRTGGARWAAERPEGIRSFLAVGVPDEVRPRIAQVQSALMGAGDVRWVPPENWHLTLKFLGHVSEGELTRLGQLLTDTSNKCSQFMIELGGVGAFPSLRRPQVVWLGAREGAAALRALADTVERVCERVGFAREPRAFHPHLTLGRVRSPRGGEELARRLAALAETSVGSWWVAELLLLRSDLSPTGATYTVLQRIPLADHP